MDNGIEQIRNKMNLLELHISRVPRHSKQWFVDFANDYFEGDYGCCLKHIIDTFRGMTPVGYDELQGQVTDLQNELNLVKELIKQPDKKQETGNEKLSMKQRIEKVRIENE